MWTYEKRLQFPVKITQTCPKTASLIISQFGGPDGELAASMRYLSQRYTMPCKEVGGLLTDIGTEELAHLEMICALTRLAVPYTGMIISTRESQQVREKVIRLGVSQISGASRTSVGGYQEEIRPTDTEQFDVSDQRSLDEVVRWLMEMGYIPSFCTACYREGRTGDRFMSLCKSGQIQNCCHPNALMTLKEFLMDYASEDTKAIGEKLIEAELANIPKDKVRDICKDHLEKIEQGIRDFRF